MRMPPLVGGALIALSAVVVACDDDDDPVNPPLPDEFTATLTGAGENPDVVTNATGSATFTLNAARTEITYAVRAANIATGTGQNITACHIHAGRASANGPVIVTLCTPNQPGPITTETEIASGTITVGDNATAKGISPIAIEHLVELLASGDAYVNVHTTPNPGGEIRGQVQIVTP